MVGLGPCRRIRVHGLHKARVTSGFERVRKEPDAPRFAFKHEHLDAMVRGVTVHHAANDICEFVADLPDLSFMPMRVEQGERRAPRTFPHGVGLAREEIPKGGTDELAAPRKAALREKLIRLREKGLGERNADNGHTRPKDS